MHRFTPLALVALTGCFELPATNDVAGNFEVQYANNLRVYLDDTLVAEVADGEDADIEYDGEIITVSTLCSDEGVECPSETFWSQVAVDQPWGPDYMLLNFVNLDVEDENAGARLGGLLDENSAFTMLSGLALSGNEHCAAIGVGVVTGTFNADATAIESGIIAYGWAAGCDIDGTQIGASLRIETDYTAVRTGDYDVSSVTPEEPIDEEGEVVDPEEPEEGYAAEENTAI
jgi:hypothetical protein